VTVALGVVAPTAAAQYEPGLAEARAQGVSPTFGIGIANASSLDRDGAGGASDRAGKRDRSGAAPSGPARGLDSGARERTIPPPAVVADDGSSTALKLALVGALMAAAIGLGIALRGRLRA
jgi:hypothetical protein